MLNDNNRDSKFGYTVGRIVGGVLVGCVAACLCGIAICATIKFLFWIF